MGVQQWAMRRKGLKLRWWGRMCRMPDERLVSLLFRRRHEEVLRGAGRFSGLRSIRDLLLQLDDAWLDRSLVRDGNGWQATVAKAVDALAKASETSRTALCVSSRSCNTRTPTACQGTWTTDTTWRARAF